MKKRRQTFQPGDSLYERWGPHINEGFAAVPTVLLMHLKDLDIGAPEQSVLVALLSFWHTEDMPYPTLEIIASRCPHNASSVRKHLGTLEAKGLIRRVPSSRKPNKYDMRPLCMKLHNLHSHSVEGTRNRAPPLSKSSAAKQSKSSARIDIKKDKRNITNSTESIESILRRRHG